MEYNAYTKYKQNTEYKYILQQHGCTSETLYWVQESSHKWLHTVNPFIPAVHEKQMHISTKPTICFQKLGWYGESALRRKGFPFVTLDSSNDRRTLCVYYIFLNDKP